MISFIGATLKRIAFCVGLVEKRPHRPDRCTLAATVSHRVVRTQREERRQILSPLTRIKKELRLRGAIDPPLSHIGDHTDDRPWRAALRDIHSLADRIGAVAKVAPGQRLIDDQDAGLACTIALLECASSRQRDVHGLEVAAADDTDVGALCRGRRLTTWGSAHRERVTQSHQRQLIRIRRTYDAGLRLEPRDEFLREQSQPRQRVPL